MTEEKDFTPKHPPTFRQELAEPVFKHMLSGESCTIVGTSSMGKTRFINSIMQPETQAYYLKAAAEKTLLVQVDFNLIDEVEDWAVFELLLSTAALKSVSFSGEGI